MSPPPALPVVARHPLLALWTGVGARPGLADELQALGGVPGHVVMVIGRTYFASGRAVETADVVIPADRYRLAYHLPVR